MAQPFEWRHPELEAGEVLLGHFEEHNFPNVPWRTKRRGKVAYDPSTGKPAEDRYDIGSFPVFVQRAELEAAGVTVEGSFTVNLPD